MLITQYQLIAIYREVSVGFDSYNIVKEYMHMCMCTTPTFDYLPIIKSP